MKRSTLSLSRLFRTLPAGRVTHFHTSASCHAITKYNMPAMSPTMTEGTITGWKKNEGDKVTSGEVLLEIETDKANIEVEAAEDGILAKIIIPAGQKVPVNSMIALIAEEGDDLSNIEVPKDEPTSVKQEEPVGKPSSATSSSPLPAPASSLEPMSSHAVNTSKITKPLSPAVLSLLLQNNIDDPSLIKATGPQGRILKGDVLAFLGRISPHETPKPSSNVPKDVQKALPTKATIPTRKPKPNVVVERSVALDELLKMRRAVNDEYNANLSLNDFLAKAASLALNDIQTIMRLEYVDEIDFLSGGSTINHDKKSLENRKNSSAMSSLAKTLTDKAQLAQIVPEEYKGLSIDIVDVGTLAVSAYAPPLKLSPLDDFGLIAGGDFSSSRQSSVFNDLDFIGYLAGESPKASALFKDPAQEIQMRLTTASGPRQLVSLKLNLDARKANQKLAGRFLDRLDWYLANPTELVL